MSTVYTSRELENRVFRYLRSNLSTERYLHSLRAAALCRTLAERFALDPGKAYLVGLLHDSAREIPPKELLERALALGVEVSPLEREKPVLLHGVISANIAKETFDLQDEEALTAIRHHTLGKPNLNPYGKVLYVADYLEPSRPFVSEGFRSRVLRLDLDEMLLRVLEEERAYRKTLAPITQEMYDEIRGIVLANQV